MNRTFVLILMGLVVVGGVSAQQFAKTGIVNLTRVSQFYKDTKAKALEDLRSSIQKDLDGMKDEIRSLMDQRAEAAKKGDAVLVKSLDTTIESKKDAFADYGRRKQEQLTAAADDLKNDSTFQKLLPQEIEQAAISKGFALILNSSNPVVIWYGPDADITDDVNQRLQADLTR
jgi:Skp family chaperone for outer membrane proteins